MKGGVVVCCVNQDDADAGGMMVDMVEEEVEVANGHVCNHRVVLVGVFDVVIVKILVHGYVIRFVMFLFRIFLIVQGRRSNK